MSGPSGTSSGAGLVPPDFLFGVATAGYQVEGGFNGPGQPANNWVRWERSGRVQLSGVACDFWRAPEEALDRARALGCNAFRLSVEWARVEPEDGALDHSTLEDYAAILRACAERGLEPIVTLHHFTHPWWLGEEFWLTPGSPDRFAAHVASVVPTLSASCTRWVTINEPNVLALMGWVTGAYPPGRRLAPSDALTVVDNLLTAHVLAYQAVHASQASATVTLNTSSSSIYEHDRLLTDLLCARSMGIDEADLDAWVAERRNVHDSLFPAAGAAEIWMRRLFAALSPYGTPSGAGSRLRRRSPRRAVDAVYGGLHERPLDTVGFDWYDPVASHAVRPPGYRSSGGWSWDPSRALWDVPPDAAGLTRWCADQHVLLPGLPLWVVENGMATLVRDGVSHPRVDGWDRPGYLRAHLAAVVAAVEAGVPVSAYLHWSLVDNYEWGSYEPRLGIFGIDRGPGPRDIRWMDTDAAGQDSASAYRTLIAGLRDGDRSVLGAGGP